MCSITSTPQPYFARMRGDQVAELVGFGRREAGGRLVEEEEARIDGERPRKADAALLAVAQAGGEPVGLRGEPELGEDLPRPRRRAAERPRPAAT